MFATASEWLEKAFVRLERRVLPPVVEPRAMPWMSLCYCSRASRDGFSVVSGTMQTDRA